jgi:hypothetical protein
MCQRYEVADADSAGGGDVGVHGGYSEAEATRGDLAGKQIPLSVDAGPGPLQD